MNESEFQKKLVKVLERFNAQILHIHGGNPAGGPTFQKSGWPDLYTAHVKWTGWLELKVGDNVCSTLQSLTIRRLRLQRVNAFVLTLNLHDDCVVFHDPRTDLRLERKSNELFVRPFAMLLEVQGLADDLSGDSLHEEQ